MNTHLTGSSKQLFSDRKITLLDGGLATELERMGFDLSGVLWSAQILLDAPEAIAAVYQSYLAAGADIITTATYQATVAGLQAHGLGRADALALITSAVAQAVAVRDAFWATSRTDKRSQPLVAASLGPYGAYLADGSEYTGAYGAQIGRAELRAFHQPQWEIYASSAADVIACETLPALHEAQALLDLLHATPTRTAWFSFSCCDAAHLADGTPIETAARLLDRETQVVAIGINCVRPQWVAELLGRLRACTDKPLLAYPNSGEVWDAAERRWVTGSCEPISDYVARAQSWVDAGATAVGGCCRTTPDHIMQLRKRLTGNA